MWILSLNSESGDVYDPILVDEQPSEEVLEKFLRNNYPDEFIGIDDGPGIFGGWLYVKWIPAVVINIK
jgi:hypothetical protein